MCGINLIILETTMKYPYLNRLISTVFVVVALLSLSGCENQSVFQADDEQVGAQSAPLAFNSSGQPTGNIPGQLIVTFKQSVANPELTARGLANGNGGEVLYTYTTAIKGFTIRVPEQATDKVMAALQNNPNVERVEQDGHVFKIATQSPATWGLDRIDQRNNSLDNSYSYSEDGSGVSVYVVDTGILYGHVDFGGRAVFGYDAIGGLSSPGSDCDGHGTHVAGTVGGATWGVAKNSSLISVRVLNCSGSGSWSGVLAGIDWITQNGSLPGVVNMSLGATGTNSTIENAITNSINAGYTYAIAAGNSNIDACNYTPARTPSAITVGSTTSADARSSFSNYGNCVDIFAPGSSIKSTYYTSTTATATMSGTSMAAPHVAGVAALYLQLNPGASPSSVRNAIVDGASQGVVTNSLSTNNHLLYSLLSDYTPPPPPPADDIAPAIDMFVVTNISSGRWTQARVDWSVSDNQGLSNVRIDLMNGNSVVHTTSINVSGTIASGSNSPRVRGSADSVRLRTTDEAGNVTSSTKSINGDDPSPPPPPPGEYPITLNATGSKIKGMWSASMTWSGASSTQVDIKRDGNNVATVPNSGNYIYNMSDKGGGSITLQVCEANSTNCSNIVTVVY